jgi:PAS domain S-box-containing protein
MNKILIVDDQPLELDLLREILDLQGYQCSIFSRGKETLNYLETQPLPHLILLDIKMPELDGYEVCKQIKSNPITQDIPVIFISGETDIDDQLKAFQVGGVDYVTKPFFPHEVLARVKTHLQLSKIQRELKQTKADLEAQFKQTTYSYDQVCRDLANFKYALDQTAIVSMTDTFGNIIYVNDKFCDICGYSRDELMGKNHRILKSGYHKNEFFTELWETISQGKIWRGVIKNKAKNGDYYWGNTTIIPLVNSEGKPQQYLAIKTNVTQQKLTESALLESQKQLQEAQALARIGSWELNLQTNTLFWSDEIYIIFEIDSKQFGANYETFLDLIHPEDRAKVNQVYLDSVNNKTPYQITHRLLMNDGRIKYVQEHCQTFYDENGNPLKSIGTVQDITEYYQIQQALTESEQRFRSVVELANEWIWEADLNGVFTYFSPKVADNIGLKPEELIGKSLFEIIPPEDVPEMWLIWQNLIQESKPFHRIKEYRLKALAQPIVLETRGMPIFDSHGKIKGFRGVEHNVTEKLRAEQLLRESEQKYRELINNLHASVVVHKPDTSISLCNNKASEILGLSYDELLGKYAFDPAWKFLTEEGKPMDYADFPVNIVIRTQKPVENYIVGLNRSDNLTVWGLVNAFPEFKDNGELEQIVVTFIDITERKQAMQALTESERRYALLTEIAPVGVYQSDSQGNIIFANTQACEMSGLTLDQVYQGNWVKVVHPEDRDWLVSLWHSTLQQKLPFSAEYRFQHNDGQVVWVLERAVANFDEQGQFQGYIGTVTDITHLRKMETALRESEELYRMTFEQAAIGIANVSLDGNYLKVNHKIAEIFGYTPAEIMTKTWQEMTHPEDLAKDLKLASRVLSGRIKTYSMEKRYYRKDGSMFWGLLNVSLRKHDNGEPDHFISTVQDITESKQAEQRIKDSEQRLEQIFSTASIGLVVLSEEGKILLVNLGAAKIFGRDKEELEGADFGIPVNTMEAKPQDLEIIQPSQQLCFVSMVATKIKWQEKPAYLVALTDVTELKETQKALHAHEHKLELITENINDVFWISDWENQQILYVSKAFENIWQHSSAQLYQDPHIWLKAIHPDDRQRVEKSFYSIVKTGNYQEEYRIIRPDGTIRWISDRGYPIKDEFSQDLTIVGCAQDISERKFAQLALQESEELHRVVLGNISDAVFLTDHQGKFTFICPNVSFIFGYSREEIATIGNIYHLLGEDVFSLEELSSKGEIHNIERVVKDRFENEHYLLINIKQFIHKEGKFLYCCRDITERKQAEAEKLALSERNETLVKTLGEIVYEYDVKQNSVNWEGAYPDLLGYSQEEMGHNRDLWLERIHPDDLGNIVFDIEEVSLRTQNSELRTQNSEQQSPINNQQSPINNQQSTINNQQSPINNQQSTITNQQSTINSHHFAYEYRLRGGNGEYVWMLDRGIVKNDSKGTPKTVVGVMMDISERKRIESAIRHIAKGVTLESETDFLKSLVKYLAYTLNSEIVLLTEVNLKTPPTLTTLVFYKNGQFYPNFSYELENTPCQMVLLEQNPNFCLYSDNVQGEFPLDFLLQDINVNTYMGMGLYSSDKQPLGMLVAMSSNPIVYNPVNQEIFQIFASRGAAELERRNAHLQLERFNRKLEQKVKQRTAELELAKENAEEKAIALRYLNEIERLVSDIATNLLMVETDQVDPYINQALTSIAKFLEVEQINIFEFNPGKQTFYQTHVSRTQNSELRTGNNVIARSTKQSELGTMSLRDQRSNQNWELLAYYCENNQDYPLLSGPSSIPNIDLSQWQISPQFISWLISQLQTKWIVVINNQEDFPPSATRERELFAQLHLKYFVCLPIQSSQKIIGFLTVISHNQNHGWNQGETNLLQLTSKLFGNAIVRKKSEIALKQAQEGLSHANDLLKREIQQKETINRKLEQSEKRYRTLFESSNDAISLFDVDTGKFVDCNEAAVKLHDTKTREGFIGKTPTQLSPQYQPNGKLSSQLAQKHIQKVLGEGGLMFEWTHCKSDGTSFPCLVSLSLIPDDEKRLILAIGRDISSIKQVQAELEKAKEAADTANKAKSEFLASMSHEIRTPMNAILGFTHLALQTELTPKQEGYLTKIHKATESLLVIINDILDFSKIEAGKLELENKDFLLEDLLDDLGNLLNVKTQQKGLEFIFDLEQNLDCVLWGDPLRLSQILINLVNNAIKFTDKGHIIVRVGRRCQVSGVRSQVTGDRSQKSEVRGQKSGVRSQESGVRFEVREQDAPTPPLPHSPITLYFCIEDTGIGIEPLRISKLFQPFTQADGSITRKYGGTGLGLVICRRLVEMMGGSIWVESEVNKGSKFHFTVTLTQGNPNIQTVPLNLSLLNHYPILVVDDSELSCQVITKLLESFSFQVKVVNSGLSAIATLQDSPENTYKLMILDWQMPEMNGIETIQAMKANPKIKKIPPVLMITAHPLLKFESLAREWGINHFINKPITKSNLFNAILEIFQQSRTKSEVRSQKSEPRRGLVTKPVQKSEVETPRYRLLLVEDNEINQEIVVELLQEYQIDIANNGIEAIEKIQAQAYDLVLMDISMPEMDGLEATRRIRALADTYYAQVPIIAMTAHAMTGDRELSLSVGMNDHITKPINPTELRQTLSHWLKTELRTQNSELRTQNSAARFEQSTIINQQSTIINQQSTIINDHSPHSLELERINTSEGIARVGGKIEIYERILRQFYQRQQTTKTEIETALTENNLETAHKLTHTLKGVAGNIGATELYQAAQNLDNALKQGITDNLESLWQDFVVKFDQIMGVLAKFNSISTNSESEITEDNQINDGEIKGSLREIRELIELDLTLALEKLENLKPLMQNSVLREKFSEIKEKIDNFDIDGAISAIETVLTD